MKAGRYLLWIVVIALVAGGAFFLGMLKGVNMVRQGLVDNYPTVRNVLNGSFIEVDSTISATITKTDNPDLYALLKGNETTDSLQVSIPYYGRYNIDMNRFVRVVRDGENAEVSVPNVVMVYCELRFENMTINGKPAGQVIKDDNYVALRAAMYNYFLPLLSKNRDNIEKAKLNVAKALVFYFEPYKFHLKLYIDNELQPVPVVPGANKDVDEYINEVFKK